MAKGTLSVTDSLDSLIAGQVSVLQYGTEAAYSQIQQENTAYNEVVKDELDTFCDISADKQRAYGIAGVIEAEEMGEFDGVDASKITGAYPIGFPLTRHGNKVGYTLDWLATNSTAQLAAQYLAARTGDQQKIQSKIRRALYYPVSRPVYLNNGNLNTAAYVDRFVPPNTALPLYPLLNGDGAPVPVGPNGETFDGSTHTHYMAVDWTAGGSTVTTRSGNVLAAQSNLLEHKISGQLMMFIHRNQESAIRALPDFVRDYDASVTVGANLTYGANNLNVMDVFNRRIGTLNGFEVWVKPWTFSGKIVFLATGGSGVEGEATSVLVWRTRPGGLWSDFNFRTPNQYNFPITADPMTRDGDCSVWGRHLAVVLDVTSDTYTTPSVF